MAHWKDAVVTNDGAEMLNEWMAGRFVKVTSAYGGSGTVPVENLIEQTGLADAKQELHLLGEAGGPDGKTVQVQVSNAGLGAEYELNQVGVFARLDPDKDPEGPERLLFIMQDEKGITVPAAADASFLLELYCMIGISNTGRFEVSISSAGVATVAFLRRTLEQAMQAHNGDPEAHPGLAARLYAAELALNGGETLPGSGPPSAETMGQKGQHYIDIETKTEYVCTGAAEDGRTWEPVGKRPAVGDELAKVQAAAKAAQDAAEAAAKAAQDAADAVSGAAAGGGRHVIATRDRAPEQPDYGLDTGAAVVLDTGADSGEGISAVVSGVEYASTNLSAGGAAVPDGAIIVKKMEE